MVLTPSGKLFPGPHLYAGAAITVLWALAASMTPAMAKGNDAARNAHITFNALNVGLFLWQVPTGIEILQKVRGGFVFLRTDLQTPPWCAHSPAVHDRDATRHLASGGDELAQRWNVPVCLTLLIGCSAPVLCCDSTSLSRSCCLQAMRIMPMQAQIVDGDSLYCRFQVWTGVPWP